MGEGAQLGEEVNLNSLHMYSVPLSFPQTQEEAREHSLHLLPPPLSFFLKHPAGPPHSGLVWSKKGKHARGWIIASSWCRGSLLTVHLWPESSYFCLWLCALTLKSWKWGDECRSEGCTAPPAFLGGPIAYAPFWRKLRPAVNDSRRHLRDVWNEWMNEWMGMLVMNK